MTYSASWDYATREFGEVPAGYKATTRRHDIVSGKLNVADGVNIACGLGLILEGEGAGGISNYVLPSASGDAVNLGGVLLFTESNYRAPTQPIRTHNNADIIEVIRVGDVRVETTVAITDVNAPVYLIYSADTNEAPGQFKVTADANAFLVKNAKWGSLSSAGVATLELLSAANPA